MLTKEVIPLEVLFLILGFIVGFLMCRMYYINKNKTYGTLEIDRTNPDSPYYRLMMSNEDFEEVPKHNKVMFKVNPNSKFASNKQSL